MQYNSESQEMLTIKYPVTNRRTTKKEVPSSELQSFLEENAINLYKIVNRRTVN